MFKLNHNLIKQEVSLALQEDIGSGDVTGQLIDVTQISKAEIITREPMLLCGTPWTMEAIKQVNADLSIEWMAQDGNWVGKPGLIAKIIGLTRDILLLERTILNFIQLLSGTATQTYQFVQAIQGFDTKLLDTRKTIPGLRHAQKYAVACGGGHNHRMGLYDAFLIKENHIKATGSITAAIAKARSLNPKLFLEVEVENLMELEEALPLKPDRILLDNFPLNGLVEAVELNKSYNCALEASGGITLENIANIAATGVPYISVGCITKSLKAIDLSLLVQEIGYEK
jgi:nicotinate-nucleotide pyrophosphorylase (carboxylating)